MRVSFEQLQREIRRVFMKYGLSEEKAEICARIHTESTYDGIYSHGVNRVSRFVDYLQKGWVDADADPVIEKDCGAIRVINGNLGPGVLNALFGADQAMALADRYGIGLVGIMATTMFPNFIVASDPALSITVANAAAGDTTLIAMTVIACIGVPLVLVYHVITYRIFRGRVSAQDLAH